MGETGDAPPAWTRAIGELEAMARGLEGIDILRAAESSGLLRLLLDGATTQDAVQRLEISTGRAEAALEALRAYGVAAVADGRWTLAAGWAELVSGATPFDLRGQLALRQVRSKQLLGSLDNAVDYWALSDDERLAVAVGVSPNPAAQVAVDAVRPSLSTMPEVIEALDTGGAVLELGCGVGSRLTTIVRAFPTATAVGVELSPDLADYGRNRAASLGVGDRITYVVGDAGSYEPDREFDWVSWSQFFFPTSTRVAALQTARRALRSGGWLSMPVIWGESSPEEGSDEARELGAERLLLDLWGVPPRTTAEVSAEVEAAGFVDVRVEADAWVNFVRARQT